MLITPELIFSKIPKATDFKLINKSIFAFDYIAKIGYNIRYSSEMVN